MGCVGGLAQPEVVPSGQSPSFLSRCIFGLSVFLLRCHFLVLFHVCHQRLSQTSYWFLKSSLEEHNSLSKETCQKTCAIPLSTRTKKRREENGGGGGGGEPPIPGGRDLGSALPGAQGQGQEHQRWSLLAVKDLGQEQRWAVGP